MTSENEAEVPQVPQMPEGDFHHPSAGHFLTDVNNVSVGGVGDDVPPAHGDKTFYCLFSNRPQWR